MRAGTAGGMEANWQDALARARQFSPFLARALERQPDLAQLLGRGEGEAALSFARSRGGETGDTAVALRREKLALSTALAVGDLAGAFPVGRVIAELSDFADRALDTAIRAVIGRRVEGAGPDGFIALALGKHGARELNYSSDIDPILLFDPETLARRERDDPGEAAQRYAREIVQMLSEITPEGYVFRVDLRLRPASEVSPLAVPLNAALTHYESSALTWERAAYIRARACAGDIAGGKDFLGAIRPFVWRRSLDFGAIQEIERLTERIRANYDGPREPGPGFNLKQGRGGIREVEFFAQTHQLIHGGRDVSLRQRGTRAALDALADAGIVAADDALALGDCYDGLRSIEHRLQMVEDRQTHSIPSGDALDQVARLTGFADAPAFLAYCRALTDPVAERFDRLIDVERAASGRGASSLSDELGQLGFADPVATAERVRGWSDGRYRTLRSSAALSAFEAIRPALLESLAEAPDPERALVRWEQLLESAASAVNLFRLIEARPGLLELLVKILTLANPLADALGRRPELLDTLIDRSALELPGDVAALIATMDAHGAEADYEQKLDRLRIVTGETRFSLGVQLITGAQDPLDVAAALARLAEAGLQFAVDAAEAEFARVHGRFADKRMAIIGLGRLGGGALTHASDLDIVYLFSGDFDGESDGARPIGPTLYFNRLAQRVSAALSVPTAEGALYEVDTRLRPQGAQGPLAVNFDSFERYQREDAWTWEHMALTRARVVGGSAGERKELAGIIARILASPRDDTKLREDVLAMRAEMAGHKPPRGPLDIKLLRGGLVDIEFIVHYLQLREGDALHPHLGTAIARLAELGLVGPELLEAYELQARTLVSARLLAGDLQPPHPGAAETLARICGCTDSAGHMSGLETARLCVAEQWNRTFEQELEIDR
ncbi:bifunctional [glutamine synthetase] adenylyltransferase/[glutamine synthetase]-adenylyl-L-tyrosine phosphorylase [Parerythrobacter lacustris]|uniref:Bifunctional [glutamine synthetase] adenylyltransferase/[glutamine synthetase]-adenylyl-L-tyrosine phosphorylase n=1 Tax=Parerythrobacter lacustris TaxID=2969984 RepID=A0ABT1XMG4_9SPHN|nr:bifunctional [glutamine synthetase] adenylyltransferase/[glutamine synthetase]-adenylyl-L-tyrosine phosphorylase [Parerythrobacter lacustris]MCR2832439.1 bifunctional [glutamine synthetase] adenylyltransferase/[glutamine synthetase]-adenylyl-L-tyrosine phosphorylase [Parerythrobacter lacustris]